MEKAILYMVLKKMGTALLAFRINAEEAKLNLRTMRRAEQRYIQTKLAQGLKEWKRVSEELKTEQAAVVKALVYYISQTLRKLVSRWKDYTWQVKEDKAMLELGVKNMLIKQIKSMSYVISCWKHFAENVRREVAAVRQGLMYLVMKKLNEAFVMWRKDSKEQQRQQWLTTRALMNLIRRVLGKSFSMWRKMKNDMVRARTNLGYACLFWVKTAKLSYFDYWREVSGYGGKLMKIRRRRLVRWATKEYAAAFDNWKAWGRYMSRINRLRLRSTLAWIERKVTAAWVLWNSRARTSRHQRVGVIRVFSHWLNRLEQSSFRIWRDECAQMRIEAAFQHRANTKAIMRWVVHNEGTKFQIWRERLMELRKTNRKWRKATQHCEMTNLSNGIITWSAQLRRQKRIVNSMRKRLGDWNKLKLVFFNQWRADARKHSWIVVNTRKLHFMQISRLMQESLRHWRGTVTGMIYAQMRANFMYNFNAKAHSVITWRGETETRLIMRTAMHKAIPHYVDYQVVPALGQWRQLTVDMKAEKTWMDFTTKHWQNMQRSIAIDVVRRYAFARTSLRNEIVRAGNFYDHTATISFMSHWMIIFARNLGWKILHSRALACYKASTLGRSMTYWIEFINFKRESNHQKQTVKDHQAWSKWGFGILALEDHKNHLEYQRHTKTVAGKHYRKTKLWNGFALWLKKAQKEKKKSRIKKLDPSVTQAMAVPLPGSRLDDEKGSKTWAFYAWTRDTQMSVKEKLKVSATNATQEMKQLRAKVEILEEEMRKRMK